MTKRFDVDGWLLPYDDSPLIIDLDTHNNLNYNNIDIENIKTTNKIQYKYNEDATLQQLASYIDATYGQHYSQNKFQATEFIIDSGHGTGFCIGNMMKYTQRYGRKGTPEEWRQDLLKVIHYAIIQLHVHNLEYKKEI